MLKKTTDIQAIAELDKECFENSKYTLKMYQDMLPTCEFYFIIETINNSSEIIGFIIISLIDDVCELVKIAIKKNFQNEGYGFEAMNQVLEQVHFKRFLLEVHQDNIPAMALYKKLGFNIIHVREKYYPDGKDAIIMEYVKQDNSNSTKIIN